MLGSSRERHRERLRKLAHRPLAISEVAQHLPPRGIAEGVKDGIHLRYLKLNHVVEYWSLMAAALDRSFAALSDPTRRAIVSRLARGPARVTDVAARFPISLNAVSKHLKVLERAGLLRRRRAGREHHLELRAAPLREIARWTSRYERFWNEKLDALGAFLEEEN